MHTYHEEDVANQGLEILSATNTWLLERHQWLIDTMRCILTGERPPPTDKLKTFDYIIPKHLKLSDHLMNSFTEIKDSLESQWLDATSAIHPMSGLTVFEQLNSYQSSAHSFMLSAKKANQKLLQEFAMRDSLTGAKTRLTMHTNLAQALNHAQSSGEQCSIAILDQNDFKEINDRWGHVIGDDVLAKTATIIQSNLRQSDQLFRFGGDEWLILMPETSKSLAQEILSRIQKAYNAYAFQSNDNHSFSSTFSYGIAESSDSMTVKEWLNHADKQLYAHKKP